MYQLSMSKHPKKGSPIKEAPPSVLSLKIPKYLLKRIYDSHEQQKDFSGNSLLLDLDAGDSLGGARLKYKQSDKANLDKMEYNNLFLHKEPPIHVFRKDTSNEENSLNFSGNITARYRVIDREKIGERTRITKELEQKKRKEIIRIDSTFDNVKATKKATRGSTFDEANKKEVQQKKKHNRKTPINFCEENNTEVNNSFDQWMPEVSDEIEGDTNYGPIVRLLGIPKDCTQGTIRRFFDGLNIVSCFSCFPFPLLTPGLKDTKSNQPTGGDSGNIVVPREPNSLRVFVQFASKDIAHLACSRDGEPCSCIEVRNGDRLQAAIRVVPIRKDIGKFLLNNGSIQILKSGPIHSLISSDTEEVPLIVQQMYLSMYLSTFSFKNCSDDKIVQMMLSANRMHHHVIDNPCDKKLMELFNKICDYDKSLGDICCQNVWMENVLMTTRSWLSNQLYLLLRCQRVSKRYHETFIK